MLTKQAPEPQRNTIPDTAKAFTNMVLPINSPGFYNKIRNVLPATTLVKMGLTGIVLCLVSGVWAQKMTAEIDTGSMLIGDKRFVILNIQVPGNWQYDTLKWLSLDTTGVIEQTGPIELQEKPEASGAFAGLIPFAVFDSGTYSLPPVQLIWKTPTGPKTLSAAPGVVFVEYPPTNTALAPLKNVIEEPTDWTDNLPYLWAVLGVLALATVLFYYLQNRTNQKTQQKETLSPLDLALQSLTPYTNKAVVTAEQAQELHTAISYTLRRYLESTYHFDALEATTELIEAHLPNLPVEPQQQQILSRLFSLTDMVKFAQLPLSTEIHAEILNQSIAWLKLNHAYRAPQELPQQP
jgi:hypothetical protein